MRIGTGMTSSCMTAIMQWLILILILPSWKLPTFYSSSIVTMFMTATQSVVTTTTTSSSSSSMMMVVVVDAAKVANPTDQYNIDDSYLRVTIRHQTFHEIPSCQHRITQIELHNLVRPRSCHYRPITNYPIFYFVLLLEFFIRSRVSNTYISLLDSLILATLRHKHSQKELIINSIQTTDETTKLLGDDDDDAYHNNARHVKGRSPGVVIDDLPQQLYMSKLPADGKLRLGPGQVAIVPVAFLPRFPVLFEDIVSVVGAVKETNRTKSRKQQERNLNERNNGEPILSPYQRADWEECMDSIKSMVTVEGDFHKMDDFTDDPHQGDNYNLVSQQKHHRRPHRNNLHMSEAPNLQPMYVNARFRLTTKVTIETNRGSFVCPFEVVSRRSNLFGLPDVIVFDIPDNVNIDNDDNDNSRNSRTAGLLHNTNNVHWNDDEGYQIKNKDRRIQETLDLFRAVKEREKLGLLNVADREANTSSNNADRSRRQNQDQFSLENNARHPFEAHDRIGDARKSESRKVRIIDRKLQQTDNDDPNRSVQLQVSKSYDCYDLYLRNPDPNMLLIVSEVLLSKSKLVNLYVIPDKRNETFVYTHPSHRHVSDWSNRSKTIFGTSVGSLSIPGDGEHHYLVTVCVAIVKQTASTVAFSDTDQSTPTSSSNTDIPYASPTAGTPNGETFLPGLPDWIDVGGKGISLGFLQIKTSQGALFVSLMKANETIRRHLLSPNGMVSRDSQPALFEDEIFIDDLIDSDHENRTNGGTNADANTEKTATRMLSTTPDSIDFSFVTTSLSSFEIPIDVINMSPHPVTIMRLAVVLDDQAQESKLNAATNSHAGGETSSTTGIDLKIVNVADALLKPIASGGVVTNTTTVICSVDWKKLLKNSASRLTLEMKGALIIRGTSEPNLSYVNWLGTLKAGSLNQSNFVVEVPLTIKAVQGTVGFLIEGTSLSVPSLWSMRRYSEMLDTVSAAFFPHHPSLTSAIIADEEKGQLRSGYSKGADHQFRIFNDMGVDVVLNGVSVVDNSTVHPTDSSICERFDTYIVERGPSDHIDLEDLRNMGLVHVRYRYPDFETLRTKKTSSKVKMLDRSYPVICNLRVTTEPSTGTHTLDFVVYYGEVAISKIPHSSDTLTDSLAATVDDTRSWYNVIVGLGNVLEWFRSTKAGFSLRSILRASTDRNNDSEQDTILLSRYLYRLARKSPNHDATSLKPVLLNVGGLEQGESTTVPLYMTNYNPVPITIRVVVGELEGQSITLGRLHISEKGATSLFGHLLSRQQVAGRGNTMASVEQRAITGRFRGHPINGLLKALMTSSVTQNYFDQFEFKDDISMSPYGVSKFPYLKKIYEQSAIWNLRAHSSPPRSIRSSLSQCNENPPTYGEFLKKAIEPPTGPIIISSDRKSFRRLNVCPDANSVSNVSKLGGIEVVIPAGGVARFDVSIRAPSQNDLPKDITHFVATGLVLESDHGELIPVLVSFKALRGSLELSPLSMSHSEGEHREINVPIQLFGVDRSHNSQLITIPPQIGHSLEDLSIDKIIVTRNFRTDNAGLSLFAKSSFSRDIHLRRIDSCNPCFSASLDTTNATVETDPFLGVHIGTARGVVTCSPIEGLPTHNTSFPSFFRCALNWLTNRGVLQPRGCGQVLTKTPLMHCNKAGDTCVQKSYDGIVQSVRRALLISEWSDEFYYGQNIAMKMNSTFAMKSGRRSIDGIISSSVIDALTDALESLDIAAKAGYLTLSTNLRAVVEYNATPDEISPVKRGSTTLHESNHTLSLAIDKTLLTSLLSTPQLLNNEKLVGVHHNNNGLQRLTFHPTVVGDTSSMKIPLRNPTGIPLRVRLGVERRRSRTHFEPPYTQKVRRSDVSPAVWANEQWWDRGGAFFQGDNNGNVIRSPYNVSVKSGLGAFISTMNPSVSSNIAFLNGCGPRCGIVENDYGLPLPVAVAEISPIGAAATAGVFVTGSGKLVKEFSGSKQLWVKRFAGSSGASFVTGGQGPNAFALPYSAMDEIIIPPYGNAELGPIFFRPTGRTEKLGCDAMTSKKSVEPCVSQVFRSTIFIENSLTGIEEVTVEGKALWEKIVFLSPDRNNEFDDIEVRHGFPTLTFSSDVTSLASMRQQSKLKEVVICNEGDVPVTIENGFLSAQKWNYVNLKKESACELNGFRIIGCNDSDGLGSFQLSPGQNRSIYIEFSPNTSRKRNYIMLNFDLGTRDDDFTTRDGMMHTFQPSGRLSPRRKDRFRRKLSLSIGHEIHDAAIKRGRLISNAMNKVDYDNKIFIETMLYQEDTRSKSQLHIIRRRRVCCAVAFVLAVLWFMLVGPKLRWCRNYSITYYSNLVGLVTPPVEGQTWRAMFRCLAPVNPSSSDLQSIGRDQTRHMVLARLKLIGALQPHCFNSAGVPKRERTGTSGVSGRHVIANSGYKNTKSTVNERVRMSDAIFGKLDALGKADGRKGLFPVQLGWRCAVARGIIDPTSLKTSPIKLTTEDLRRRRTQPIPSRIQAAVGRSSYDGDNSTSTSGLDSSLGDLSVDESLPNDVPEIVTYDRETITSVSSSAEQTDLIATGGNSLSQKSFPSEKKRVEIQLQRDNVSERLTTLEDEKPTTEVDHSYGKIPSPTVVESTMAATREVADLPNDESVDFENEASPDDRIKNIQAGSKIPAEKRTHKRSTNTSSKVVAKAKASTKKEKVPVKLPSTGNTGTGVNSSNAVAVEDIKSSVFETKKKNQSIVARSKGKSEKVNGRGRGAISSNILSKADITVTKRLSVGIDHLDRLNTASLSPRVLPPTRLLLPPPGFNEDLASPDQSLASARSAWNAQHAAVMAISDNHTAYPLSLDIAADREISHPTPQSASQSSHIQYSPLQQNLIVDDPLLGYSSHPVPSTNISFMRTELPSSAAIIGPTSHIAIPYRAEDLDVLRTSTTTTPLHQSMVPGLSSLVPSFSMDNEDQSNSINNNSQYGTSSMMMDFDVMDFLDQILEEGQTESGIDQLDNPTADGNNNTGMILNNIVPMAAINPWSMETSENSGTSYHQNLSSRAAAYGIAFDSGSSHHRYMSFNDDDNNNLSHVNTINDGESPMMMRTEAMANRNDVVPLLTPLAIMTSVNNNADDNNNNNNEEANNRNSSNNNYTGNATYVSSPSQQSFYGGGGNFQS